MSGIGLNHDVPTMLPLLLIDEILQRRRIKETYAAKVGQLKDGMKGLSPMTILESAADKIEGYDGISRVVYWSGRA